MQIEISEATFRRLQAHAEPFVDTVEDTLTRLLDSYENESQNRLEEATPESPQKHNGEKMLLKGFQKELWELVVLTMPTKEFSLRDVYARKAPLTKRRPHVKELEASIRGGLEKLRDKGYLEFIDNRGRYRRLV